ncbi:MAG: right-handed parallel beta-helix repeat-containing protein, partial [Candidatus Lokiarchaeota archaeon]
MKKAKIFLIGSILLFGGILSMFTFIFNFETNQQTLANNEKISPRGSYYNNSMSPIFINGDAYGIGAHNWSWAESQPWCSGNGNEAEPYIIAKLTINGMRLSSCILIRNSIAFFRIENCTLYNSSAGSGDPRKAGIKLLNCQNGEIYNNFILNNKGNGISLGSSSFNIISENTISNNNYYGISLYSNCNNNTISENTISNSQIDGIFLSYSSSNIISENTCSKNRDGIWISHGSDNTISWNIISNNTMEGISIFSCSNNIEFNRIYNNPVGIYVGDGDVKNNFISQNWIWNNPIRMAGSNIGDNYIGNNFYYSFYNPDTDGDGLSDELELGIGTNPSLYDTDGDN